MVQDKTNEFADFLARWQISDQLGLKVIGKRQISNASFIDIEGGFGQEKKSILARDIAKLHHRSTKKVNELINRNIIHFKKGIDLIDLKQVAVKDLFYEMGFSKAQIGNSKHIYLLSERGYTKILKIMDDEKAWAIYGQLMSNYFNMRHQLQSRKPDSYMIEDPIKRAKRWIEEREAYEKALPKAQYFDKQMRNPGLMTITEIAEPYGMSSKAMNRKLHELGVQYRQGRSWVLYQKYKNQGYAQPEPYAHKDNNGVTNLLKWTQKGKKFIYDLLAEHGIKPVLEQSDYLGLDGK